MVIREEKIEEFRRLYKEELGTELTVAEAQEMVQWLVLLYERLMQARPQDANQKESEEVSI